jgi:tetratricopeptide (TPR) repeat protein
MANCMPHIRKASGSRGLSWRHGLLALLGLGLLGAVPGAGERLGLPPALAAKKEPPKKEGGEKQEEEVKQKVKKLFEDGMVQYDLRRFDAAITLFEKAFETRPDPVFLYNIAQAHRMAGRPADAAAFYRNFLRKAPDAPNANDVKGWIAQLDKEAGGKQTSIAPPPVDPPVPYLEPKSKQSFMSRMTVDGKSYFLTGVGHRSYMGFSVYGMGLYVDDSLARRAFPKLVAQAGGTELQQLRARDLAQNFVVLGEFGKAAVLRFSRKLTGKQIADSYRDLLKENLKETAAPALRQSTQQFLALFNRDVATNDEMIIATTSDGLISVTTNSVRVDGPRDATLCIDLWNMWLGGKPLSTDMKQTLVERIALLGQGATGTPAGSSAGGGK